MLVCHYFWAFVDVLGWLAGWLAGGLNSARRRVLEDPQFSLADNACIAFAIME